MNALPHSSMRLPIAAQKRPVSSTSIKCSTTGFTLAELLIALLILGVIATFTIPKVLQVKQASAYQSQAKEVAGMLTSALQMYQFKNGSHQYPSTADLTPYMNYVAEDDANDIDHVPYATNIDCAGGSFTCLKLHSGGMLAFYDNDAFCATSNETAIRFIYDPNGTYSGATQAPDKSVAFWLYNNGKIGTYGSIEDTYYTYNGSGTACTGNDVHSDLLDPSWFSWN